MREFYRQPSTMEKWNKIQNDHQLHKNDRLEHSFLDHTSCDQWISCHYSVGKGKYSRE